MVDSPEWLKNKKATINPKNNDDKSFQYAITVAVNHVQTKSHPERITKIKYFINQYNWKEIGFLSNKKSWKMLESNNKSTALNILDVSYNSKDSRHAYKSKHNLNRENELIGLMITDSEKWHYLTVRKCLYCLEE